MMTGETATLDLRVRIFAINLKDPALLVVAAHATWGFI